MRHLASKWLRQNLDWTGSDHGPDHGSDRITDRITDRVILIEIINFARQAKRKRKPAWHNEAQELLGDFPFCFCFFVSVFLSFAQKPRVATFTAVKGKVTLFIHCISFRCIYIQIDKNYCLTKLESKIKTKIFKMKRKHLLFKEAVCENNISLI